MSSPLDPALAAAIVDAVAASLPASLDRAQMDRYVADHVAVIRRTHTTTRGEERTHVLYRFQGATYSTKHALVNTLVNLFSGDDDFSRPQ